MGHAMANVPDDQHENGKHVAFPTKLRGYRTRSITARAARDRRIITAMPRPPLPGVNIRQNPTDRYAGRSFSNACDIAPYDRRR